MRCGQAAAVHAARTSQRNRPSRFGSPGVSRGFGGGDVLFRLLDELFDSQLPAASSCCIRAIAGTPAFVPLSIVLLIGSGWRRDENSRVAALPARRRDSQSSRPITDVALEQRHARRGRLLKSPSKVADFGSMGPVSTAPSGRPPDAR